jgi:hypothetical protein
MARRRWWQVSLAMLFAVVTAFALLFGLIKPELPPRPMVPTTDRDKQILSLATSFLAANGLSDYKVPMRIVPHATGDGTVSVIYWTPRRELRMAGVRAVIVNPESESVSLAMRE